MKEEYIINRDGSKWCASGPGFRNLEESPAGFGDTPKKALQALFDTTDPNVAKRPFVLHSQVNPGAHIDEKYPTQYGHKLPRTIHCSACNGYTTVYEGTALPITCFHCKEPFNEAPAESYSKPKPTLFSGTAYLGSLDLSDKPKPTPLTPAEHSVELTRPRMRDMAFNCLDMIDDIYGRPDINQWVYYILTKIVHALANRHSAELRRLHAEVKERYDATT